MQSVHSKLPQRNDAPSQGGTGLHGGKIGQLFSGLPARQDVERRAVSGSHQGPPGESQLDPAMPPKATA